MASVASNSNNAQEEDRLRERLKQRQQERKSSSSEGNPERNRHHRRDEGGRRHSDMRRDSPHHRGGPPPPPYHRGGMDEPYRGGGGWPDRREGGYRGGPPPDARRGNGGYYPPDRHHHRHDRRHDRRYDEPHGRRGGHRSRSRSRSRSPSWSDDSYDSDSSASSASSASSRSSAASLERQDTKAEDALTKDRRTVFVSQLVMRATERELSRYLRKSSAQAKVNEVIMLREKRTGRSKGCAYVELRSLDDLPNVLNLSGEPPDFQRFPILIKASEAEKNYVASSNHTSLTADQVMGGATDAAAKSRKNTSGVEAQKVYIGNLDPKMSQNLIYSVFSKFGFLDKVQVQLDPLTGMSRGFAFLSYRDAKDANLAIQTMSGKTVIGRPMKTGWANSTSSTTPVGTKIVTSTEFPPDAAARIQNANLVLSQVSGATSSNLEVPLVSTTTASASPSAAAVVAVAGKVLPVAPTTDKDEAKALPPATVIGNADKPTNMVLVHNMFDKDEETEPKWDEDIRMDFEEECSKWGKIRSVQVMSQEAGGKVYAAFDAISEAQTCATNLAGRWFDKRQLRVEFVTEIPKKEG